MVHGRSAVPNKHVSCFSTSHVAVYALKLLIQVGLSIKPQSGEMQQQPDIDTHGNTHLLHKICANDNGNWVVSISVNQRRNLEQLCLYQTLKNIYKVCTSCLSLLVPGCHLFANPPQIPRENVPFPFPHSLDHQGMNVHVCIGVFVCVCGG